MLASTVRRKKGTSDRTDRVFVCSSYNAGGTHFCHHNALHEAPVLYVEGWSQADIGEHLSISQASVSDDLKFIRQEWPHLAMPNSTSPAVVSESPRSVD